MSNFTIPTLNTYVEIVEDLLQNWFSCVPWAQPQWAAEVIFGFCVVFLLFYIYTLVHIIKLIKRRKRIENPFYKCILVLAMGDIVILVTSSKEGVVQSCVLASSSERHLAWESIGAFCIDLIISLNLVLSFIRFRAVTVLGKGENSKKSNFMDLLILFSFVYSLLMGILHHLGFVKKIWYPVEAEYHDEYFVPFNYIRTNLQCAEVFLTFMMYLLVFFNLQKIKNTVTSTTLQREFRFLAMAFLIFISELMYIYATNWLGMNVFHIGSGEFNANLNYVVRPLVTGITPFLYIAFSSEIRNEVLMRKSSSVVQMPNSAKIGVTRNSTMITISQHQ